MTFKNHFLITVMLIAGVASAFGQDSVPQNRRIVIKPAYLTGMVPQKRTIGRIADSIANENAALKAQNDSLLLMLNNESASVQSVRTELASANEEVEKLKVALEDAKGNQLQTSHTSSILLIFNIIAGLILLITLIWIYSRKKPGDEHEEEKPHLNGNGNHHMKDSMETRLERIEKLGKLRDKGLLTEEEFQLQKKQILE